MKGRAGRFPVVLTLVCLAAFALLCGLGTWQVRRLAWKEDLLARIEAARHASPVSLDEALARPDPEYARVTVLCRGLDRARFIELHAIVDGGPGWRLVSVCSDDTPLLVDRGFVADTVSERPEVGDAVMPVAVAGVLRRGEAANAFTPPPEATRVWVRDISAMAQALEAVDARTDLMLVAETSSNPEWRALEPHALPQGLSNNHLGYAVTWFGLAAALVGVWAAFARRAMRRP